MKATLSAFEVASSRPRPAWLYLLFYLLAWLVVLLVLSTQTSWGVELGWFLAFARVFRDWGPWILLGPLLWWLVKAFPLFGRKKLRHFLMHVVASLLVIALAEVLVAFVFFPASQAIIEKSEVSTRDLMRALRGERPRPATRIQNYRLRSRTMARKAQIWLLLYWVFVMIGTAVRQRRIAEERTRRALTLKSDLERAQFREMQSRLNPHFLFNVLNSISALIAVEPDKADAMVGQLSSLLRRVLQNSENPLIQLDEELSLLRDYLAIEQVRFSDRLTIREDIDPRLLSARIPPLTLQPIAENAIKHGIEPKSEASELSISIQTEVPDQIEIRISDDGVGLSAGDASEGFGLGVQSVRDRLENTFPGRSTLNLWDRDGGGTVVIITIPREWKLEGDDV